MGEWRDESRTYRLWQRRSKGILRTQRVAAEGIEYLPSEGPALLTPNHLNWKDVFFISAKIPRQVHFVATYELFHMGECARMVYRYGVGKLGGWVKPIMGRLSRWVARTIVPRMSDMEAIPVKRQSNDRRVFEHIKERLKRGQVVCIFPEGGTGRVGELRRFKRGAAKVVFDLWDEGVKVPMLPVAVLGTHRYFNFGRRLRFKVGRPFYLSDHLENGGEDNLESFTQSLYQRVKEVLEG